MNILYSFFKKNKVIRISFLSGFCFFFFISCTSAPKDISFKKRLALFKKALIDARFREKLKESESVLTFMQRDQSELKGKSIENLDELQKDQIFFRKALLKLERNLESETEKRQYYSYKPYLIHDEARIEFLLLQGVEEREEWLKKRKLFSFETKRKNLFRNLIERQDVAIGMNQREVLASLGRPYSIAVSGQRMYQNEIWYYLDVLDEKAEEFIEFRGVDLLDGKEREGLKDYYNRINRVYFEGGMVVGWDRQKI